jgi:hypothetical protein
LRPGEALGALELVLGEQASELSAQRRQIGAPHVNGAVGQLGVRRRLPPGMLL